MSWLHCQKAIIWYILEASFFNSLRLFSFSWLLLKNLYHTLPAFFFLFLYSIVSLLVVFLRLFFFSFKLLRSTISFLFIRFPITLQVRMCFVYAFILKPKTFSIFYIACIASTELIVFYTELLNIGGLTPLKFLFFEMLN